MVIDSKCVYKRHKTFVRNGIWQHRILIINVFTHFMLNFIELAGVVITTKQ
jgi:hypothetical protein